ncbi:MAG: MFS transporter [Bryobacterales bacterium]|nr:MFS transporter [Bryobacterales bacterium]
MRQRLSPFIVIFAIFLSFSGPIGSTLPLMPLYLRQNLGLDRFYTGVLMGLLSAAALAGRLWAGPFADRRGRRAGLWLGFCLCSVAGLLYLPLFGVAGMAIGRLTHGLGEAFILTGGVAWMVDTAPEGGRSQALGYLASGVWGGLAVGPLVAEAMRTFPHTAMLVTAAGVLSALVLFATQAPPVRKGGPKPKMRLGVVALPGSILGFTNIGYAVLAAFMPLLLDSRGLSGRARVHRVRHDGAHFPLAAGFASRSLGSAQDADGRARHDGGGLLTAARQPLRSDVGGRRCHRWLWLLLPVAVSRGDRGGASGGARTGFGFGRAHRLLRSLRRRWRSRCGRHWQSVRSGAGLLLRDREMWVFGALGVVWRTGFRA